MRPEAILLLHWHSNCFRVNMIWHGVTLSIPQLVPGCLVPSPPAERVATHPSRPYFLPPSLNITLFCPTRNWRGFLPDSSTLWTVKLSCQQPSLPIQQSTPSTNLHFHQRFCSIFPPPFLHQRIENQINLYLKFNKQFDFEDDMQRTKANFAGGYMYLGIFKHSLEKKKQNLKNDQNNCPQQNYVLLQKTVQPFLINRALLQKYWSQTVRNTFSCSGQIQLIILEKYCTRKSAPWQSSSAAGESKCSSSAEQWGRIAKFWSKIKRGQRLS